MGAGTKTSEEKNASAFVAQVVAATATREDQIFAAPSKCRVRGVRVTPQAAATGDNTHTKNLNVVNKGAAGIGTAELGNLDLVTGVNLVAFDEANIPFSATYAQGADLASGDVLTLQTQKVGNGIDVGPFHVTVDWEPL